MNTSVLMKDTADVPPVQGLRPEGGAYSALASITTPADGGAGQSTPRSMQPREGRTPRGPGSRRTRRRSPRPRARARDLADVISHAVVPDPLGPGREIRELVLGL